MRLLFCIKAMNNPGGGSERVLAEVARGLAARGHEIAVLSFDAPGGTSFYPLSPEIKRIELGIGSTTDPAKFLWTLKRIAALRANVRRYAPDVAIGFMHSMFIPLGLALVGTSIPMIASEHIVPQHYDSRPLEALLLRLTPLWAQRITCVSEQVRHAYPTYMQRKMVAIANPITTYAHGRADVSGSSRARKILLSVGRLEPQKDHETLIKAFAEIVDQVPSWDLRIVGDGNLLSKLTFMVAKLGLEERICFVGTKKDVTAEYLSAHLFVMPSRYESFGLTTAEALAHGLPAVGFDDCLGINQLLHPGINGDLARGNKKRVESLALTLKRLMENDALRVRMSEQSYGVPPECRIDNVLENWEKVISDSMR